MVCMHTKKEIETVCKSVMSVQRDTQLVCNLAACVNGYAWTNKEMKRSCASC